MKLTPRAWTAGSVAAVAAMVAGGWFLGVQPQLAHADEANANATATEAQVATTQARIAALAKVAASQPELEAKAEVLGKSVPTALQANTLIRRLNSIAALDAVNVQSVAVGSATAYTAPKAAAAAATAVVAATPAPTPSPSGAAAAAPAVAPPPVLAATDPLITGEDFTVIPMTVVVKGSSAAGLQFIKDLQRDERLFLVSGFTAGADPADPASVTTTLTGSIYALKA